MFPPGIGYKNIILKFSSCRKKASEYVIDETVIKVSPEHVWIWLVDIIEHENKEILRMSIQREQKTCLW
jgi:putative transposase